MGYIFSRLRSLEEQHRKLDEDIRKMEAEHRDNEYIKKSKITKLKLKEEIEQIKSDIEK